jgi:hypothetical protein
MHINKKRSIIETQISIYNLNFFQINIAIVEEDLRYSFNYNRD